jgi:hypothetical protein
MHGAEHFVDVAEQARPIDLVVPFENSGRAGACGKDAGEQVEGSKDTSPGPGDAVTTAGFKMYASTYRPRSVSATVNSASITCSGGITV